MGDVQTGKATSVLTESGSVVVWGSGGAAGRGGGGGPEGGGGVGGGGGGGGGVEWLHEGTGNLSG